ncbi:MAG TPA: hypothetical protein VK808_13830 [Bacteroidia bacterium]|jgi:HD superfamily phosphohydrolase|nr:hypothetical protein [Bacteroidia bacterium]
MPKSRIERIQDNVHGLMEFNDLETLVIEVLHTQEVQRLRRVKQLGLANLVFPAAEHSRFVHSIGTAHLAIRFARQIRSKCHDDYSSFLIPDKEVVRDFAIASLCHDLGHGPLSHMWEREIIGENYDHILWIKKFGLNESDFSGKPKWHELVGQALLAWEDGEIHKLLEAHDNGFSDRIRSLLRGEYFIPYIPNLLVGDIDMDRADYIKRDSFQTGVAYGKYDLEWLLSTCTLGVSDDNKLVVGFEAKKGIRVVEQILGARKAMYDTVYNHKTIRSAEGMVGVFLKRLKYVLTNNPSFQNSNKLLEPIKKIVDREALEINELLKLDDFFLWSLITSLTQSPLHIDTTLQDLGKRILSRTLFKQVNCSSEKLQHFLVATGDEPHKKIVECIKPYCDGEADYYYVLDEKRFKTISRKGSGSYLIESDGKAIPFLYHKELKPFDGEIHEYRLFTVSEAIEDVKKLIEES